MAAQTACINFSTSSFFLVENRLFSDILEKISSKEGCRIDSRAFTKDGLIINQSLLRDLPNGWFSSDKNGCGWIAVYNVLTMLGAKVKPEWIIDDLRHGLVLGGKFGTHVFYILHYFNKRGYRVRTCAIPKRFAAVARTAGACILLYRHSKGNHFAALRRENDSFHFYNARSGKADDVRTMEEFLAQERRIPPCLLIAVNKRFPEP